MASELGTVDVLIHSAGGSGYLEPQVDSDEPLDVVLHNWTLNFGLNTLTAALLTEALKDRLADPGGRVLFLSSIAAFRGPAAGRTRRPRPRCTRTPTTWPGSWGRAGSP